MISMEKKYRTRDGREARVLAVDAKGGAPVVALVESGRGGYEQVLVFSAEGAAFPFCQNSNDLIEVEPEHTRWFICHPINSFGSYEKALEHLSRFAEHDASTYAIKPLTFREGERIQQ